MYIYFLLLGWQWWANHVSTL